MDKKEEKQFQNRMNRHIEELRWLYMELYHNESMFAELCQNLYEFAKERPAALKKRGDTGGGAGGCGGIDALYGSE